MAIETNARYILRRTKFILYFVIYRFMQQKVLQLGNPILRNKSKSVKLESVPSNKVTEIINRLTDVMKGIKKISSSYGNGLAAPQIGYNYRIIVLYFDNKYHVLINPNIVERSKQSFEYNEGCLSFFYLRGAIERNRVIKVVAYDEECNEVQYTFSDDLAGLVQHEIDHLDGILYLDGVINIKKIVSVYEKYKDNKNKLDVIKRIIAYVAA